MPIPWRDAWKRAEGPPEATGHRTTAFTSVILPKSSAKEHGGQMKSLAPKPVLRGEVANKWNRRHGRPRNPGLMDLSSLIGPSLWGRPWCQCERCSAPRSLDSSCGHPTFCQADEMLKTCISLPFYHFMAPSGRSCIFESHLFPLPHFVLALYENPPIVLHKCSAKGLFLQIILNLPVPSRIFLPSQEASPISSNPAAPARPVRAGWSQSKGPQLGRSGRSEAGKGVWRIVGGFPPQTVLLDIVLPSFPLHISPIS